MGQDEAKLSSVAIDLKAKYPGIEIRSLLFQDCTPHFSEILEKCIGDIDVSILVNCLRNLKFGQILDHSI